MADTLIVHFTAMIIFIKTLMGQTVTLFDVDQNDQLIMVKRKIMDQIQYPPRAQRLIHAGQQLDDHKTVSDYNIKNEYTLIMVLKSGYRAQPFAIFIQLNYNINSFKCRYIGNDFAPNSKENKSIKTFKQELGRYLRKDEFDKNYDLYHGDSQLQDTFMFWMGDRFNQTLIEESPSKVQHVTFAIKSKGDNSWYIQHQIHL